MQEVMDKIICGDSAEILKKLPSESFHLAITSPPYGKYKKYSNLYNDLGNLDIMQQVPVYLKIFKEIHRLLQPGRRFCLFFCDIYQRDKFGVFLVNPAAIFVPPLTELGFRLKNVFIWRKPGSFSNLRKGRGLPPNPVIQSYFEYIFVFQKAGRCNIEYITPEIRQKSGIPMKQVCRQSGIFDFRNDPQLKKVHPAIFPLQMAENLIMLYSFVKDLVLDPFCGIGTTCCAAKALERNYLGIDINPYYCEIARKRSENVTPIVEGINLWIDSKRGKFQGTLI